MSALGKYGIVEMAENNLTNAHYAKDKFVENGLEVLEGQVFNEFVVKLNKDIGEINETLADDGFIGGYDLGQVDDSLKNHMLVTVTELRTKDEIDTFVERLGELNA